jgi:hypothetical protein
MVGCSVLFFSAARLAWSLGLGREQPVEPGVGVLGDPPVLVSQGLFVLALDVATTSPVVARMCGLGGGPHECVVVLVPIGDVVDPPALGDLDAIQQIPWGRACDCVFASCCVRCWVYAVVAHLMEWMRFFLALRVWPSRKQMVA